jgi:hypothetical protein
MGSGSNGTNFIGSKIDKETVEGMKKNIANRKNKLAISGFKIAFTK